MNSSWMNSTPSEASTLEMEGSTELGTTETMELEAPLHRWQYTSIAIYLTFVGVIATTGNTLVVWVLVKYNKFKTAPHQYIILNLAIADLGISVFGYPYTTAAGYAGRWLIGRTGCTVYGFFCTTMALTDINTLLVLSVYRYVAVCKPQFKARLASMRVVALSVGSCWLYSLAWAIAPLIGWSSYDFENFGTSCSIKWDSQAATDVTYTVLMTLGCYVSHIIVMGWCYYHVIKTSSRAIANLANPVSTTTARAINKIFYEMKTTWMVLAMVSTFTIVWSPYAWVAFWSMLKPDGVPDWMFTFPTLFAKSSCMLNPLIYVATDRTFRHAAKVVLFGRCRPKVEPEPECIYNIKISPELETQRVCMVDITDAGIYIGSNEVRLASSPGVF